MPESIEAVEAEYGSRMIEVKVRFWTNGLVEGKGNIIPKHGKTQGVVRIETNQAHGIVAGKPKPFNSMAEIGPAIEAVLLDRGVTLHVVGKSERLFVAE